MVYGIKTPEEFREPSLFDFGMLDADLKTTSFSAAARLRYSASIKYG
jgi:hypothetical protein